MINSINLQTPYVVKENTLSRLCCEYEYNNKKSSIWFEVSNEYTDYLCFERCDAFVIGLLDFAMRHGCNIKSEAPISDYLLYQLEKYVLAVFSKSSDKMFCVKIDAPIATDSLSNANAVGTGISCGVD